MLVVVLLHNVEEDQVLNPSLPRNPNPKPPTPSFSFTYIASRRTACWYVIQTVRARIPPQFFLKKETQAFKTATPVSEHY
jgi:hypothetical protein